MDAFAESQMGRGALPDVSPMPRRRTIDATATDASEELLTKLAKEEEPVDVPCMNLEESELIKQRWERKKAAFMPVGDPYEERDHSVPYVKQFARHYCTCASVLSKIWATLCQLFPVITWLPKTRLSSLQADVIAGLTVGVMLIPQSMSYAAIAGLEYKYGMYTSVLPVITYALMGTSRQLGVGPVAMISLLIEVGLKGLLTEEECPQYYEQFNTTSAAYVADEADLVDQSELCPTEYAQLAFLTSFLVGLFQLAGGFLRLGFLVSFLAHPVISGFTSAAAIVIGLSQVQYFVGFKIPKSQHVHETVYHLFSKLSCCLQWEQLLFGLAWWFMLSMSRRLAFKYKKRLGWLRPSAPLITCVLAIVVGANMELFNGCGFTVCDPEETNKLIVGTIPSGVSSMGSVHLLDLSRLGDVLMAAISCTVIGYMESIAIAKSLASKHKYEVDAGQELLALGVSNLLGSLTSAYPVTGSFSRSAVNNQVGAQTQLAGMITGFLLLVTLLLLTPAFYFLPKFALAAIVIASVTNLVDYKEAMHLWKVKKQDFLLWIVAFLGTLFLGVQVGLILAISASLALVIIESIRPQMTLLWRLPNSHIYRNIKQESVGHFVPGVMVIRIGASMYFANVAFIRDYISSMIGEFSAAAEPIPAIRSKEGAAPIQEEGVVDVVVTPGVEPIRYIVIEMTPVTSIDSTALHMLEDMHRALLDRGIRLAFSTLALPVEDTLKRAGLINSMGDQWIHPSVHSAVQQCIRHRQRRDFEEAQPSSTPDSCTPERQAPKGSSGDGIDPTPAEALTPADALNGNVVVQPEVVVRA